VPTEESIFGTVNGGMGYTYDTTLVVLTRNNNSGIPDNSIAEMAQDAAGNYWFASPAAGVFVQFSNTIWQSFNQANSGMPVSAANSIFIDSSDLQFIGTEQNGIVLHSASDQWSYYNTTNSPLPDDFIHHIQKDKSGAIWIGTRSGGLVLWEPGPTALFPLENLIQLYPNPCSSYIQIKSAEAMVETVQIFDLLGQKIEIIATETQEGWMISTSGLTAGIYQVCIAGLRGKSCHSFVKI
jgi:ligand-binding sensor domain-containing protein